MLNVVVLMGRLVADPELRHTPNDVAVTTIRIAVDRSYAKAGGEKQTDFIDVTAWRQTAEFVCRYFTKGSMIAVQGALHVDNYTDRDGNKRTRYDVQADNVSFCGSKRESGTYDGGGASYGNPPQKNAYQQPSAPAAPAPAAPAYSSGDTGDFQALPDDDDLPF
ncbi:MULTISPECIES: single-stranded DNA-binding protein [Caproicibacterium]|uniref:Single-stranded DNA-binding protein n=1 Tax=Caproicibacterium argilliputei TaxID=3030016 RepID=A0AA97D866_9FIRM|nr:single-stranded DNA-binding protein [Caproicibacterium argilliputei]WOC31079.1 single-stranded DNA-binding protein [Caproicibacterium argilliputei]